jgi:site-specific recombinase XerD
MQWLRRDGVLPATDPSPADRVGRAMVPFEEYLVHERGITTATVEYHYRRVIRSFLAWRFRRGPVVLGEIRPRDVTSFQLRLARDEGRDRAQSAVYTLRVFLRYLRMRGHVDADLAACVLPVAHWRLATIPSWIEARDVRRILVHCDRRDAKGLRDYAILLLIARLGLRAGEVVGLRLEDLRWESGEIVVRGSKCRRLDRLPLPHDVGAALAAYLRHGRPRGSAREVFVRMYAPRRAMTSGGLSTIVKRAIARAGLDPPHKGPHILRHSLATHMLAKGASLAEVGEILRHADAETTAIYAKVDLKSLRSVAQPWPGGGR